ncbi:MAG: hypothetical protein II467_05060 [Bacilli bacterium]|nr:hypothetical protein [Bacilli bacterium]
MDDFAVHREVAFNVAIDGGVEGIGVARKGVRSGVEDLAAIPSPAVFGVGFGYVAVFDDIGALLRVVSKVIDGSAVARPIKEFTRFLRRFGFTAAADFIGIEDIGSGEDDLFRGGCFFAGGLFFAAFFLRRGLAFLGGSFAGTGIEAGIMRSGAGTTAAGGQEQGACG